MHDDRSSPESAADMAVFDDTRKLHMALGLMSNAEKDNIEIGRRLEAAEARIEELEGELRSLTPAQQPASPVTDDQYRKKPVVIRAWRLGSEEARPEWAKWAFGNGHDYAEVQTLEGTMRGNRGDWIIQGVKGELYFCKPDIFAATYEPASAPAQGTRGCADIAAERQRQINEEGWTAERDDHYWHGKLASAGLCYVYAGIFGPHDRDAGFVQRYWPWHSQWWKPSDTRRNLVKAGALVAAEIDRLDRASALSSTERHCEFCHVPMADVDCCDSEFESKGCPHTAVTRPDGDTP